MFIQIKADLLLIPKESDVSTDLALLDLAIFSWRRLYSEKTWSTAENITWVKFLLAVQCWEQAKLILLSGIIAAEERILHPWDVLSPYIMPPSSPPLRSALNNSQCHRYFLQCIEKDHNGPWMPLKCSCLGLKGARQNVLFSSESLSNKGKMIGGTPEVRSDKSLTLLTFNIWHSTNGPMDQ